VRLAAEDTGAPADLREAVTADGERRGAAEDDREDLPVARVAAPGLAGGQPQQREVEEPARVDRQLVEAVAGRDRAVVPVLHGHPSREVVTRDLSSRGRWRG
jgi:hypothetical protein